MIARGRMGEEIVREFGTYLHTFLYLKQITNKIVLYSKGNSAQCYITNYMGKEFEKE